LVLLTLSHNSHRAIAMPTMKKRLI